MRRLADQSAQERKAHTEWASTLVEQQQQLGAHVTTLTTEYEGLLKNVNRMIRRLQQCYERVGNTYSMIHPEAEQKRKDGDRPDRVEGLTESRIQNRMRSLGHDIDL